MAAAAAPRVEIQWWEGCPSWERAIAILTEEMAAAGLDPGELIVTEVVDEEQAERLRFPGSPTILVDVRDVQDNEGQPTGLTCRVYRLRDGRASPLPDRADIAAALRAAPKGEL
jgi:hypothetical protein